MPDAVDDVVKGPVPEGLRRQQALVGGSDQQANHIVTAVVPRCFIAMLLIVSSFRPGHSRQAQEKLFQLVDRQWRRTLGRAAGAIQAVTQTRGDDLEAGAIERSRHCSQLRHDVLTVASLLDHRDDAAELPVCPAQPVEGGLDVCGAVNPLRHVAASIRCHHSFIPYPPWYILDHD
jgi:hypothetical protein